MWIIKKLFIIAGILLIIPFSAEAGAKLKIGVLVYTQESIYQEGLNGIMDQLRKEGFGESKVDFIVENVEGNKSRAAEVANKFAAPGIDLVIVLGTSAAMIVANEIKNKPVVFSVVYDPVETKIVRNWKSSGNNVTGSSTKMPMSNIMNTLKQFAPVKKLAVFYEPTEMNSVLQLKELQGEQNSSQIRVVPVPITRQEDVMLLLPNVIGNADALFIAGSKILGEKVPEIVDAATRARLITITHLRERVERGVLLGACANSYAVGLLAGERAAKVLRGAKPSSIPIGTLKKFDVLVNMKTAKEGQFRIPPNFIKTVTKTIE